MRGTMVVGGLSTQVWACVMNKFQELLVAGLIAAIVTGAVAGAVIWKITATQHDFVAQQFAAQNSKVQAVGDALAKTASDLKRLDGALKTTEGTLSQVKDQISMVGTRGGIAQLNAMVAGANKTLADIKRATAPDQAKAALAPLATRLDTARQSLTALQAKLDDKTRDQTVARIEIALAGVKDALAKQPSDSAQANAKLDDALKALAALSQTANGLKSNVDSDAAKLAAISKSLSALGTSVKQGFADTASQQAGLMKAVEKPASTPVPAPPKPSKPEQDLVVLYVSMAGAPPATTAALASPGLTPVVPSPFAVRFERLGGVDDEGQTKLIVDKVRTLIKGHSGCNIAVAGHADTLGGDRANYELSKRRANEVADKLRAAFAGEFIPVSETQWGERRLAQWTPDDTANEANRRVDIKVSCQK